jgi:hypothetical protein
MDVKVASAICLNLSGELINNVIQEENAKTIWQFHSN